MSKVSVSLPNAYGPYSFMGHDPGKPDAWVALEMERHCGNFGIWTSVEGDEKFHMLEFTDGCYRGSLPVSLETLKEVRNSIDEYIKSQEDPT